MLEDRLHKRLEKSIKPLKDSIKEGQTLVRWVMGTFGIGIDQILLKLVFYDHHIEEKGMKRQAETEARLTKTQAEMEERFVKTIQNSITQLKLELKLEHQAKTVPDSGQGWWG
ncbi:unnamed protein product [Tuber aestivum]|uniref:Uncharacterized protein n=1 Tax=Tuber aestivum TaxID=59557 RepID=A0A292PJD4_9PEZI|nr:unnamed protein product [Tuber aestivum]